MDVNTLRDVSDSAIDTANEDLRRINLDVCARPHIYHFIVLQNLTSLTLLTSCTPTLRYYTKSTTLIKL